MKRFGLIIAIGLEIEALLEEKNSSLKVIETSPFLIYELDLDNERVLYIIKSGCGEELAAIASTYLINKYKVEALFNYGIVGGLNPNIEYQDTGIIYEAVHHDFDTTGFDSDITKGFHTIFNTDKFELDKNLISKALEIKNLPLYRLASGNRFIYKNEERLALYDEFKCDVVDMELIGIIFSAKLFNVPLLSLKAVSDVSENIEENENPYYNSALKAAKIILNIVKNI